MKFLDVFLNVFAWYRRRRGGKWVHVLHYPSPPAEAWHRNPSRADIDSWGASGWEEILKVEKYGLMNDD